MPWLHWMCARLAVFICQVSSDHEKALPSFSEAGSSACRPNRGMFMDSSVFSSGSAKGERSEKNPCCCADVIVALSGTMNHGLSSAARSEEHTSELQSRGHLVCRLLLEKKK